MSYLERFIRGCFVQPKYSPQSFLTFISCYAGGGVFMFLSNIFNKDPYYFQGRTLFCILCLILILMNAFALFIKFWVESDWPLWIGYISGIASLYMPIYFTSLFESTFEDFIVGSVIVSVSAILQFIYLLIYHKIFKIDPLLRGKPHSFIGLGFMFFCLFLTGIMFVMLEITKNNIYFVYAVTFICSTFSATAFMSFTRVMDFWQKPVETGQRYGDSMKKLARKKK